MRIPPELRTAAEAGRTILAPNAELAAALFDALERAQQEAGRECWSTPKVRDFGSWAREQYSVRHAADETLPRQLSDIEERELWRQVVEASEASRDFLDIGLAARAARRARRTILEFAIPWRRVAAEATEETAIFLDWNRAFEARCRDMDCVGAVLPPQSLPAPEPSLVWVESPSWRPAVRRWLEGHAVPIAPISTESAQRALFQAATPGAEWSAMAAFMHERINAASGFRAWIFVPGLASRRAEIEDAFDARLEPQRFVMPTVLAPARYAVAGGTPLSGYASVRAALQLLSLSAGAVSFAQFSSLLRAPELQEHEVDTRVATRLDLALRRHGPHESTLRGWLSLADEQLRQRGLIPVPALQRLRAALNVLESAPAGQRMSEWIGVWVRALNAGPWSMRQRWSSVEFQAAERFRELLAALAGAESFFGRQSREQAQRILARSAHETPFQPHTGIPPIWISGQPLDPWLQYDAVWLSGMSEAQWPPPVEPVAMLPVALQRAFGILAADAGTQLAQARELLNRWQQRGAECIFSYSDAEGRSAAPSPLLPPAAPLRLADSSAQPHWRLLRAQAPALHRFTDTQGPPFAAPERTRGVATLRAQSRCAFRGFAEIRLGAERLEQPVPGFNDGERGELVHHALQAIWTELGHWEALQALPLDAQSDLLQRTAGRAVEAVSRRRDPGPQWRQRERRRLSDLLDKWLAVERGREPFVVESLEGDLQLARLAGLELQVRLDRVDRLADGSRVLIDYKTGSASVDWRGDRPDNPQLPLYALLKPEALVAVAYGKVNAADPGFLAESERKNIFRPQGKATLLEEQPSLSALIAIWAQRLEALAAAFAAGQAEVAPTARACRSCALQGLCRVPTVLQESEP